MDMNRLTGWMPAASWTSIDVIDAHTGGEPFRIVVSGLPEILGSTVLERRRYATNHFDDFRKILMWEPRGHADMYGGWLGAPVESDSDISVLFVHNAGFSTMCGHGIIALTKVAFDTGLIQTEGPRTTLRIDTPAGQIVSSADTSGTLAGDIRFRNVPSFVDALDLTVEVAGLGQVRYDLAFGGAYYAYVEASALGIAWPPSDASEIIDTGRRIKLAIANSHEIDHPEHHDLGFLYGVIFSGPPVDPANHSRNVCVFANGEIDRSPTGTGVSGRVAIEAARGKLSAGESLSIESIVGSKFDVRYLEDSWCGDREAVTPEVAGSAHMTGRSTFWVDPSDPLGTGFLIR